MDLSEVRKHVQGLAETLKMIDDLILERDKWRNQARLDRLALVKAEKEIDDQIKVCDQLRIEIGRLEATARIGK